MKLTDIFFTLDRLIARERNVISESRTVKFAANHNAEVLEKVKEIIDYSATAEMMAPPEVQYRAVEEPDVSTPEKLRGYMGVPDPERYFLSEVASTRTPPPPPPPTPFSKNWVPDSDCGCFRCVYYFNSKLEHRVDVDPRSPGDSPILEAGIVLGPQPATHTVSEFDGQRYFCSCGIATCDKFERTT